MSPETFYRAALRDDRETAVEAVITVYSWGAPERAPAYDHGGLPADPPELEVTAAFGENGQSVELTEAERERIAAEFLEDPPEPNGPDYDQT